jgi:hypothetical protein
MTRRVLASIPSGIRFAGDLAARRGKGWLERTGWGCLRVCPGG